ncbi:unnamed protein product [Lathyrus sativus]|nr:unnamed protein product [Lathyrus sativus]
MWPDVQVDELQPPTYKNGHGRPRKVRIRECGKKCARKRRPGVAYKCTKCDKFDHNTLTCNSLTRDPNALKIKRKPKVEKNPVNVEDSVMPTDVEATVVPIDVKTTSMPPENNPIMQTQVSTVMPPENNPTMQTRVSTVMLTVQSQTESCVVDTSQSQAKKRKKKISH